MQINELEISKKLRTSVNPESLEDIVANHGWEILGTGAEALVAKHPHKPYVLKIFRNTSKYIAFVELCLKHASNPHFPKFSREVRPIKGTMWNYVRMEQLQKVPWSYREESLKFPSEIGYLEWKLINSGFWAGGLPLSLTPNVGILQGKNFIDLVNVVGKADLAWMQAVDLVIEQAKKIGIKQLDLHTANLMQRDNTLVIIDPFY